MGEKVEGGIELNQGLEKFAAFSADVPVKDQIDLMSRCWFSLAPKRTDPIEHEYIDRRSNLIETVKITGTTEHGIATIHDQDLLIFVISQWLEGKRIGMQTTRRISFTPYQFFTWINRQPGGSAYQRLKDALMRLKSTNIETTLRSTSLRGKRKVRQFSWISEWQVTEDAGQIKGVEVVLAEWLFESIQDFHVLTLDKRYFDIESSIERWLYVYARKATGGTNGIWRETFKSLYKKSASKGAFKHFASALRKAIKKDELPGLHLAQVTSAAGHDVLHMERTEKRVASEKKPARLVEETQLVLIEKLPFEECWENALEMLAQRFGTETVSAWMKPLQFRGIKDGVLVFGAKTGFVAERVHSLYHSAILETCRKFDGTITGLSIEVKGKPIAA
ncbi:MAG: replication initiator protein A [Chthoniobacteraceae bacterium]